MLQVAINSNGDAAVAWNTKVTSKFSGVGAAVRPAGESWQAVGLLAEGDPEDWSVAIGDNGDVIVLIAGELPGRAVMQAVRRSHGQEWPTAEELTAIPLEDAATGQRMTQPQVAIAPTGTAVAAWVRRPEMVVQGSVWLAGGGWQPVKDLSGTGCDWPQVVVDSAGNAAVLWQRTAQTADQLSKYSLEMAVCGVGGLWGPIRTVTERSAELQEPYLACSPGGRMAVIWLHSDGNEQLVRVASADDGWRAEDVSGPLWRHNTPRLDLDDKGNAVAVWFSLEVPERNLYVTTRPAGKRWQPVRLLSERGTNGGFPELALHEGRAVAAWSRHHPDDGTWMFQAAWQPTEGHWQPVSGGARARRHAQVPTLRLSPRGDACTIWSSEDPRDVLTVTGLLRGDAWPAPGHRSPWEAAYRRYRKLQRSVVQRTNGVDSEQFIRYGATRDTTRDHLIYKGVSPGDAETFALIREILDIRDQVANVTAQDPAGTLEDVYLAALHIVFRHDWQPSPDASLYFRGQRNRRWPVVPTLYRERPSTEEITEQLHRTGQYVRWLQMLRPELSEEQAVAVAQHYSSEAGVSTWLLDWTWDPLVGLFFASLDAEDGEVGIVWMIVDAEWKELSANGRNRLGARRVIEVPEVQRIAAQRALFIDTSHPDLFEQLIAYDVRFQQHLGTVFEDRDRDPPVTRDHLLPPDDALLSASQTWKPPARSPNLTFLPGPDTSSPLDPADYFELTRSWFEEDHVPLPEGAAGVLWLVCDLHARLQRERDRLEPSQRSLQRLRDSVASMRARLEQGVWTAEDDTWTLVIDKRALEEAVELTIGRGGASEAERDLMRRIFGDVLEEWLLRELPRRA